MRRMASPDSHGVREKNREKRGVKERVRAGGWNEEDRVARLAWREREEQRETRREGEGRAGGWNEEDRVA